MKVALYVCFGTLFGFVLSQSGATDYGFIQAMFLFESFQLYGIIGTAVFVIAPGLWLPKRYGLTYDRQPLQVPTKPRHRGNIVGGVMFGMGWSITGMCPGPVLVNLGEGKLYAWAALAGVLVGTGLFGVLYPRIAPSMGLRPLNAPQAQATRP